jgi:transposase
VRCSPLVLYDVTSTYLEGKACDLAKYGYNRDKKKGKTQIIFGLLCDVKGCPIAVEVFEGNTKDSSTIAN